jgi:hypothetical protein
MEICKQVIHEHWCNQLEACNLQDVPANRIWPERNTHRGSFAWFVCLAAEDGDRLTGSGEEIGEWRTGIGSPARWLRCWRCFEGEDGMEACMEKKWWLYRLFSFSQANRRGRCTMKNFLFFLDNLVWRKPISLFGCIGRLSVLDIHLIFPIRSGVRYSVTC